EQDRADDEAGMMARQMGELPPSGRIADCIDTAIGGAQPRIDANAIAPAGDAGGFKAKSDHIRLAPGSHQNMCCINAVHAGRTLKMQRWPAMSTRFRAQDTALLVNLDALGGK